MFYITKEPCTLLDAAALMSPDSSKSTLRQWIRDKRITVDGKIVVRADAPIAAGQKVALNKKKQLLAPGTEILYEDRHIIAIDKREGLLSVDTDGGGQVSVHSLLKKRFHPKKVYVVHRLDQETSGVILFALSQEAFQALKEIFRSHDLERRYIALVEGELGEKAGTWDCFLFEDSAYRVHATKDKGERAITHYEELDYRKGISRLELKLETGKKHQIRVHCKEAGHPVVGDKRYGATLDPYHRVCLHAYALIFKHPITGEQVSLFSEPPKNWV